jgi:EAL domain-containing protein (putative c-di-GMP-specific phosphodiesterase class I)
LYFVNFAPDAVYRPDWCLALSLAAAKEAGIRPRDLVFETSEPEASADLRHIRSLRDYLGAADIGFGLDHVGVGAASAALIRELQPDYVKVTGALLSNIEQPATASAIRRMVDVAEKAGTRMIASGVEHESTVENLWLLGVEWMQGWFFGMPKPRTALLENDLPMLARALDARTPLIPTILQ